MWWWKSRLSSRNSPGNERTLILEVRGRILPRQKGKDTPAFPKVTDQSQGRPVSRAYLGWTKDPRSEGIYSDVKERDKRDLKRWDSDLLEEEDDSLDHLGPLLLQAEQGARRADEDLGLAVGHVVVKSTALQEPLHRVLIGAQVVIGPREL